MIVFVRILKKYSAVSAKHTQKNFRGIQMVPWGGDSKILRWGARALMGGDSPLMGGTPPNTPYWTALMLSSIVRPWLQNKLSPSPLSWGVNIFWEGVTKINKKTFGQFGIQLVYNLWMSHKKAQKGRMRQRAYRLFCWSIRN